MKILIAFASRYGTTEKCARLLGDVLSKEMHAVDIVDLSLKKSVVIKDYNAVVVGGSFLMFRMNPLVQRFVNTNLNELLKIRTCVFMVGADDKWEEEIKKGFPETLLNNSTVKGYFGYEMLWDKMNPFFRGMAQKSYNTTENVSKIDNDSIEKFAIELTKV